MPICSSKTFELIPLELSDSGIEPDDGAGRLKVILSEESANVLEKVHSLKRWEVAPPMSRGYRGPAQPAEKADVPKAKGVSTKKKNKKDKKNKKTVKFHIKKPKVDPGKSKGKIVLQVEDCTDKSIRRTNEGREAVRSLLAVLLETYDKCFPQSPLFGSDGKLRMTFKGADKFTWQMIQNHGPKAMEALSLACIM